MDKKEIKKRTNTLEYLIYSETKFDRNEVTIVIPDLLLNSDGHLETYMVFMNVETHIDGMELETITYEIKFYIEKLFDCLKKYGFDENLKLTTFGPKSSSGVWGYMITKIYFEEEKLYFDVQFGCETSQISS